VVDFSYSEITWKFRSARSFRGSACEIPHCRMWT